MFAYGQSELVHRVRCSKVIKDELTHERTDTKYGVAALSKYLNVCHEPSNNVGLIMTLKKISQ